MEQGGVGMLTEVISMLVQSFQEVKMGLPVGRQEVAVDIIRDRHLDAHMWRILAQHHNRRVKLNCCEVFIKGLR